MTGSKTAARILRGSFRTSGGVVPAAQEEPGEGLDSADEEEAEDAGDQGDAVNLGHFGGVAAVDENEVCLLYTSRCV